MKIKLDDTHTLISDSYCYWIVQEIVPKDKKPYVRRSSGYTATFSQCVENYIENKIKSLESELISDLAKEIEELKAEVRNWHEVISGKSDD